MGSISVALAAFALQASPAAAPEGPHIGRCHMGSCSWFRIHSRAALREAGGERLLRVMMSGGGSEYRNDRPPSSARGVRIQWDATRYDAYFLCSARRPFAIVAREGGGRDAVPLDFVNGPAGATTAVSAEYVAACHPGDDMDRPGFAGRHGYGESSTIEPFQLARPEDIFATGN